MRSSARVCTIIETANDLGELNERQAAIIARGGKLEKELACVGFLLVMHQLLRGLSSESSCIRIFLFLHFRPTGRVRKGKSHAHVLNRLPLSLRPQAAKR